MKYSERHLRNTILLNLGESGLTQKQKGLAVGLSQQAVSNLVKRAAQGLPVCQKRLGATARLSADQRNELPTLLAKGSESYGFKGEFWTCKRVKFVIEQTYGVVYEIKQVGRILKKIGWTRQKPQLKDAQQDLAKVEQWQTEELPALKKSISRGLRYLLSRRIDPATVCQRGSHVCAERGNARAGAFRYQRLSARMHRQQHL